MLYLRRHQACAINLEHVLLLVLGQMMSSGSKRRRFERQHDASDARDEPCNALLTPDNLACSDQQAQHTCDSELFEALPHATWECAHLII